MSDEEVICTFMEPRPERGQTFPIEGPLPHPLWWSHMDREGNWHPASLGSLDALHKVQAGLTDEQWRRYDDEMLLTLPRDSFEWEIRKAYIHADVPAKIKTLAAVLRSNA